MSEKLRLAIEKFDSNGWKVVTEKIGVDLYSVYASCKKGSVKLGEYKTKQNERIEVEMIKKLITGVLLLVGLLSLSCTGECATVTVHATGTGYNQALAKRGAVVTALRAGAEILGSNAVKRGNIHRCVFSPVGDGTFNCTITMDVNND